MYFKCIFHSSRYQVLCLIVSFHAIQTRIKIGSVGTGSIKRFNYDFSLYPDPKSLSLLKNSALLSIVTGIPVFTFTEPP